VVLVKEVSLAEVAPSFGKARGSKPLLSLTDSRPAWQYFFSSRNRCRQGWNVSHLCRQNSPEICQPSHFTNENCRHGCEHSHLAGKLFGNKCRHSQVIREPSRLIRKRSFSTTEDTESTKNFFGRCIGPEDVQCNTNHFFSVSSVLSVVNICHIWLSISERAAAFCRPGTLGAFHRPSRGDKRSRRRLLRSAEGLRG